MYQRFFLSLLLILLCLNSFGQQKLDVKEIFTKVENFYKDKNDYSYLSTYKLFENKSSSKTVDEYFGEIIKKDKVTYQKINKVTFVSFDHYNISVNDLEKTIVIVKAKAASKSMPIVLASLLKICDKNKVIEDKNYWICELLSENVNQKQFTKIYIYVNKNDFSIYKQVFYAIGNQQVEKNKKLIILRDPRLEILYVQNNKVKNSAEHMTEGYYFSVKNKKIKPSRRFTKYKLTIL
jgi:outer membrane lipoprotein-sorting protein